MKEACEQFRRTAPDADIDYFVCDIRDFKKVEAMVDYAIQKWGRVDILVNGAAGNFLVPFEKMSVNAFRTVMEIDTFGTFHVFQ